MKIVYAGTPEFSVRPLTAILEAGYNVVAVLTQEDKPQGRKGVLTPSPVKALALQKNIPVFQPKKLRENVDALRAFGGDVLITCAYGQILTQDVLESFSLGVFNLHAGLLPFYRGASPIQNAIKNGEKETGVCLMQTELGLDTGAILAVEKTEIKQYETFGELSSRLSEISAKVLVENLDKIETGNFTLTPQSEDGACVYKKIPVEEAKISFFDSVENICNKIHAFNPEPTAYCFLDGVRISLFRAEKAELFAEEENAKIGEIVSDQPKRGLIVKAKDGGVKITELQPAGGKKMRATDFLNGRKAKKGQVFYADESPV